MNLPMNFYTISVLTFNQFINKKLAKWTTRTFLVVLNPLQFMEQLAFLHPFFLAIVSPEPFALASKTNHYLFAQSHVNLLTFISSSYTIIKSIMKYAFENRITLLKPVCLPFPPHPNA